MDKDVALRNLTAEYVKSDLETCHVCKKRLLAHKLYLTDYSDRIYCSAQCFLANKSYLKRKPKERKKDND